MAKSSLETQIRSRIDALAAELSGLVRQAAFESLQSALGTSGAAATTTVPRRGPGRPKGSGKRRGGRPANPQTEALTPRVLEHLKANAGGQGVGDIAKALKVDVERVKPVMAKLLESKQVRKTGQKRGTRYFPAGGGGGAGAGTGAATAKPAAKRGRRRGRKAAGKA
jgi:hypothetical protein